jgi:hypothetical protein
MSTLTHACHCGKIYPSFWRYLLHSCFCAAPKPREHFVPPDSSLQAWDVGPHRCFVCLAHEDAPEFSRPCPGHRPSGVELA